jgi:hypothetical protein
MNSSPASASSSSLSDASTLNSDYPELRIVEEYSGDKFRPQQNLSDQELLKRAFGASVREKKAAVRSWIVETNQQNRVNQSTQPAEFSFQHSNHIKQNRESIDSTPTSDSDSVLSNAFPLGSDLPAFSLVTDFSEDPNFESHCSTCCSDQDLLKRAFNDYITQQRVEAKNWIIETRQENVVQNFKQIVDQRVEILSSDELSLPGVPIYD